MFENVEGRTTDAGDIGILIAHLGAFGSGGSGELKTKVLMTNGSLMKVESTVYSRYLKFKGTGQNMSSCQ